MDAETGALITGFVMGLSVGFTIGMVLIAVLLPRSPRRATAGRDSYGPRWADDPRVCTSESRWGPVPHTYGARNRCTHCGHAGPGGARESGA